MRIDIGIRRISPAQMLVIFGALSVIIAGATMMRAHNVNTIVIGTRPIDVLVHVHKPEDTHYDHMEWAEGTLIVPEDMWVTGLSATVEGAPHNILHNAYLSLSNERDAWCPDNPRPLWSGGTVSTKKPSTFEKPYGILLHKGDQLLLEAAFHGEKNDNLDVTFNVELTYERAGRSTRSQPLLFSMIDPSGCDRHRPIFTIPPQVTAQLYDSKQRPFVFPEDATVLRVGAHFHGSYEEDITNAVRLFLNDTMVDEFKTTTIKNDYDRNPRLGAEALPLSVQAGDKLWMEAAFDNPSDTPVFEGMAIVGFFYTIR